MQPVNNQYDFLCGNDSRFLTIAVKGDVFHTIRIHADLAKTIDFSGGTKKIETILLSRCFKLTRIHWPQASGSIKRLQIAFSDSLATLDLADLSNLEELSIIDCAQLSNIKNLPKTLKKINIQGAKLTSLDASNCKSLQCYHIATIAKTFHCEFTGFNALATVSIQLNSGQNEETALPIACQFKHCAALHLINIETSDQPAQITIADCPNLLSLHIASGEKSIFSGISGCAKLTFLSLSQHENINLNDANKHTYQKLNAETDEAAYKQNNKENLIEIKKIINAFRDPILHPEPGPDDMETTIQQNSTPRDKNSARQVLISLLGTPFDNPENQDSNDIYKRRITLMTEGVRQFLNNKSMLIYYLNATNDENPFETFESIARYPNQEEDIITTWLENKDERQPNILLLTEEAMSIPSVLRFIDTFNPNKRLIIYNNQYYHLNDHHKILADISLKPTIEHFSTKRELPLTLSAQQQFESAVNATRFLITQNNPQVAKSIISNRNLKDTIKQYLTQISRLNYDHQGSILQQTNETIMNPNDLTFSQDTLPISTDIQPAIRASQGGLFGDQQDNVYSSKPARSGSHQSADFPFGKSTNTLASQSGKLKAKDTLDPMHYSAKADSKAGTEIKSLKPQRGKLVPAENHDPVYYQASVSVKASAGISQPAKPDDLLQAASDLANAMKNIVKCAIIKPIEQPADHLTNAANDIDASLSALTAVIETHSELDNQEALAKKMEAARDLTNAVRRLNLACEKLYLTAGTPIPSTQSFGQFEKTASRQKISTQETRDKLLTILKKAQTAYISANHTSTPAENIFGTGFQAGIHTARLNMLKRMTQTIEEHESLKPNEVEAFITELNKSPLLKDLLSPHLDALTTCLTKTKKLHHGN